ncbi:MAG: hypothetical protein HQK51_13510, partial [Oligoflexia bacterium]|nr:hypothetical protein [Oligoflexia bacterium]
NTFQSICMDNVEITKGSGDLEYVFEIVDQSWLDSKIQNRAFESMAENTSLETIRNTLKRSGTDLVTEIRNNSKGMILVTLKLKKYYSAINEGKSKLSSYAQELLGGDKKDLISFFNACGAYYVRSLVRVSTFHAFLTFDKANSENSATFKAEFKSEIEKRVIGIHGQDILSQNADQQFNQKAEEKHLKIYINGIGLNNDSLENLLATDIESFRQSINNALKALKSSDVGRVVSMEIAPWTDNLAFQINIGVTFTNNDPDKPQEAWLSKIYQEQNAEFITHVERVRKFLMATYQQVLSCKTDLELNWGENLQNILFKNLADSSPENSAKSGQWIKDELVKSRDFLKTKHEQLLKGIIGCYDFIKSANNLSSDFYYNFTPCQKLEEKLVAPTRLDVLNYCMPVFHSVVKPN